MAVAHDAASESHTGTAASVSEGSFTWEHDPVGTPRGVLVFTFTAGSATEHVTAVTYEGTSLTKVTGGSAADTATEPGRTTAWFLGSSVPTADTATVEVTRTNNANAVYAVCITVTANSDTAVHEAGIVLVQENAAASPEKSVDDGSPGTDSVRYAAIHYGGGAVPTVGSNSTNLHSIVYSNDPNSAAASVVRETTAGQGSRSVGWSAGASDDNASVFLAVKEAGTNANATPSTVAAVAAITSSGITTADANATPSTVASVAAVPTPSVDTGGGTPATATPSTVAAVAALSAPTITSTAVPTPSTVQAATAMQVPSVITGGQSNLLLSAIGDLEISNTTAESSIFSGTVPGGTLGTNGLLVLRMIADSYNNTGVGTQNFTLRVKFGGVTIHTFTSIDQVSGPGYRADFTNVFLGAQGATNSQRSMMEHKQGGPGSGDGTMEGGNDHNSSVNRSISVDSTAPQTLEITVQLEAASADLRFRRRGVWVEHQSPNTGQGTSVVEIDTSTFTYDNSAAETSVATMVIPGGTIGTGNLVLIRILADVLHNVGTNQNWYYRAYFGGVQIFDGQPGVSNASSASLRSFPVELWICGHGATNDQVVGMISQALNTAVGSGSGNLGNVGWQANNSLNTCAIDTTTDQTFELKAILSTASTNLDYTYRAGLLAVIR